MWIEMDLLTNFALVLLNFASIIQRQDPILKSPDENIEAKSSAIYARNNFNLPRKPKTIIIHNSYSCQYDYTA